MLRAISSSGVPSRAKSAPSLRVCVSRRDTANLPHQTAPPRRIGEIRQWRQSSNANRCGCGRPGRRSAPTSRASTSPARSRRKRVAAIKQAWGDHLVLRFRGQSLTDDDLMRFSRQFGELDWAPIAATNDAPEGREYIMVVSNVVENGQPIGQLGAYEAVWHTDMSYVAEPPMASALYSLEAPPSGGDTGFCNMYLAYDTLPAELRRAVEGKLCRHDASRNSAGELRRGFVDAPDPTQVVGAEHPIVRTHPAPAGRRCFSDGAATPTSRAAARRERGAARRAVGALHQAGIRLVSAMAGRRFDPVGQPLRHAPARRLRPGDPARHAPHPDPGRPPVLTGEAAPCIGLGGRVCWSR